MEHHHVQSINRIYKWAVDSIAIKPSNLQVSIHPQDQSNIEPEKWTKMVGSKDELLRQDLEKSSISYSSVIEVPLDD